MIVVDAMAEATTSTCGKKRVRSNGSLGFVDYLVCFAFYPSTKKIEIIQIFINFIGQGLSNNTRAWDVFSCREGC